MTFCMLGDRCAVYDPHARTPGLALTGPLCTACRERARSDLNRLRLDYVDLSQFIPKQDARSETKIFRPKPESTPPINMAAWELRSQIAYFVAMSGMVLRRALGTTTGGMLRKAREGYALDHDIRWLSERVDELARLPKILHYWTEDKMALTSMSGIDVLGEFGRLHRRSRSLCGLEPKIIRVPGYCPDCKLMSLRRHDDNPKVWCNVCKLGIGPVEYQRILSMNEPVPRNSQD